MWACVMMHISRSENNLSKLIRSGERYYLCIKGKIRQADISILNIYAPNTRAPTIVKETRLQSKSHTDRPMLLVGDLRMPISPLKTKAKQRNAGANRYYKPNEPNQCSQIVPAKHERINLLLSTA